MVSYMKFIPIEVEVQVGWNQDLTQAYAWLVQSENRSIPWVVRKWAETIISEEFNLTHHEEKDQCMSVTRMIELEVEMEYNMKGDVKDVTCQTECPGFVKAWAENEAKKRYPQEEGKV